MVSHYSPSIFSLSTPRGGFFLDDTSGDDPEGDYVGLSDADLLALEAELDCEYFSDEEEENEGGESERDEGGSVDEEKKEPLHEPPHAAADDGDDGDNGSIQTNPLFKQFLLSSQSQNDTYEQITATHKSFLETQRQRQTIQPPTPNDPPSPHPHETETGILPPASLAPLFPPKLSPTARPSPPPFLGLLVSPPLQRPSFPSEILPPSIFGPA